MSEQLFSLIFNWKRMDPITKAITFSEAERRPLAAAEREMKAETTAIVSDVSDKTNRSEQKEKKIIS